MRRAVYRRIAESASHEFSRGWVVDVGCGPGLLEAQLRGKIPRDLLIGLDIDSEMLKLARKAGCAHLIKASASYLPICEDSVSMVLSSASMKDWAEKEAALGEAVRVLGPSGVALLYEFLTIGEGSHPPDFLRTFGILSDLLRRTAKLVVPFSLSECRVLLESVKGDVEASIDAEPDLAMVRMTLRKPSR